MTPDTAVAVSMIVGAPLSTVLLIVTDPAKLGPAAERKRRIERIAKLIDGNTRR